MKLKMFPLDEKKDLDIFPHYTYIHKRKDFIASCTENCPMCEMNIPKKRVVQIPPREE